MVLSRLARHMSGIMKGYRGLDSYVRRDPRASQHTLDGQMAVVLAEGILDFVLFVNKKGGSVASAHRCDFWLAYRQDFPVPGGTGLGEFFVLLDTKAKNISCSLLEIAAF